MVKKIVKGFGALTYKHADGMVRSARYNEEIDVHADDVKRLTDAGAFDEDAILEMPKATDIPVVEEPVQEPAPAPKKRG